MSVQPEDYFLFYAPGANQWTFDSLSGKFQFQKNPYSDASFFFIQIGEKNGLRIGDKEVVSSPSQLVESFTEHIRYEKEEINLITVISNNDLGINLACNYINE